MVYGLDIWFCSDIAVRVNNKKGNGLDLEHRS